MDATSLTLLQRIATPTGEQDWLRFYETYRPFIAKQLRTFPGLQNDADDIAQEVMLIVRKEVGGFDRQRLGSFRCWLRNVTLNQIRGALRSRKRHAVCMGDAPELEARLSEWSDPASIASKRWDEEHDQRIYEQAMIAVKRQVNETTWQAFEQYVLQGKDPHRVSEELQISLDSVYLAKSRITRRLRDEIAGLIDE